VGVGQAGQEVLCALAATVLATASCARPSDVPTAGPGHEWFEGTYEIRTGREVMRCDIAPGRERCGNTVTDRVVGRTCGPGVDTEVPALRDAVAPLAPPRARPRRTGREFVVAGRRCAEWALDLETGGQIVSCRDLVWRVLRTGLRPAPEQRDEIEGLVLSTEVRAPDGRVEVRSEITRIEPRAVDRSVFRCP
jgi:hypothetical protein